MSDEQEAAAAKARASPRRRRAKDAGTAFWHDTLGAERLEELTRELFMLHDLNNNGVLEEVELIKLNQKIAVLHHGLDTDTAEVKSKYKRLFRDKLDPNGEPVPYAIFRDYAREVLESLDSDPEAQEMILEQFVAEAESGRQAFNLELLLKEPDFPLKESDIPVMLNKVLEDFSTAMNANVGSYEWHLQQPPVVPGSIIALPSVEEDCETASESRCHESDLYGTSRERRQGSDAQKFFGKASLRTSVRKEL